MIPPRNCHNTDFRYCFYGHEFKKATVDDKEVYDTLHSFLRSQQMDFYPLVDQGKWLWEGLVRGMERSAFCFFESNSNNRNVHIELGHALALNRDVVLAIKDEKIAESLPSDLSGMIQLRYRDQRHLEERLKNELPKRFYSVEERLKLALGSITAVERVYLSILLERGDEFGFSDLATRAFHRASVESSDPALATFMRRFDEALIITPSSTLPQFKIRVDPSCVDLLKQYLGHMKEANKTLQRTADKLCG